MIAELGLSAVLQRGANPRGAICPHPLGLLRAARGEIDRVGVEDRDELIKSSPICCLLKNIFKGECTSSGSKWGRTKEGAGE
jgi:hypothetical protein